MASRTTSAPLSPVRKLMAMVAPRLASSMAIARPMPRDAPVMRATLPWRGFATGKVVSVNTAVPMQLLLPSVHGFKDGGDALTAADAHRDQGVLSADSVQLVQRLHGDDRSGSPQGMAQG